MGEGTWRAEPCPHTTRPSSLGAGGASPLTHSDGERLLGDSAGPRLAGPGHHPGSRARSSPAGTTSTRPPTLLLSPQALDHPPWVPSAPRAAPAAPQLSAANAPQQRQCCRGSARGDSVSQGRGGRAARAQSYGWGDGLPAATLRPLVRWHVYRVRVRPPCVWSWQGERAQVEAVRSLPKSPLRPRPGWAVTEASRPPLLAPVSAAGGDLSGPNCCLAQPVTDPILQTAEPRVV